MGNTIVYKRKEGMWKSHENEERDNQKIEPSYHPLKDA